MLLHATTVEYKGRGIVITGKPQSGKSSLALCLIERGAMLVADDQTEIELIDEKLIARAPEALAGLIEIHGLGICRFPYLRRVSLHLAVELLPASSVERMPPPDELPLLGVSLPLLRLDSAKELGVIKIQQTLASLA